MFGVVLMAPYEPVMLIWLSKDEGGDWEDGDSSSIVSGTSIGRNADASSSVEYSLSRSCGIEESSRRSMYRYDSINSLVRS